MAKLLSNICDGWLIARDRDEDSISDMDIEEMIPKEVLPME